MQLNDNLDANKKLKSLSIIEIMSSLKNEHESREDSEKCKS